MKKSFNIELPQDFDEYGIFQCWYFSPILLTPTQENVVRGLIGEKSNANIIFDIFTDITDSRYANVPFSSTFYSAGRKERLTINGLYGVHIIEKDGHIIPFTIRNAICDGYVIQYSCSKHDYIIRPCVSLETDAPLSIKTDDNVHFIPVGYEGMPDYFWSPEEANKVAAYLEKICPVGGRHGKEKQE